MILEQNTNYASKLKQLDNPSFEDVRDLSVEVYRNLPQELQDELHVTLNQGGDVLNSEPQMIAYMFLYGNMFQDNFNHALCCLPDKFSELDAINIIDYGCGQAVGMMCYADFLTHNGYHQRIKSITLIDPSEICLKRAALHASTFFPQAEIKTINKEFDNLTEDDITYSSDIPSLNIFSNVLGLLNFDLDRLVSMVKRCIKGYNYFVCVDSIFTDDTREKRLERFTSTLNGDYVRQKALNSYELDCKKRWNCLIKVFPVGDPPMMQTKEEIEVIFKELYYHQYGSPLPSNYKVTVAINDKDFGALTESIIRYLEEGFEWKYQDHKDILSYCIQPLRFDLENPYKKDLELNMDEDIVGVLINKQEHVFVVVANGN